MEQVQMERPEEDQDVKEEDSEEECIFCKIAKGETETEFVKESENFVAFLDINPKVERHTLIIPKKHYANLLDLPSDLASEMVDMAKEIAGEELEKGAEGFNAVMSNFEAAGQEVKHAHLHILPRKKDDGFKLAI